MIHSYEYVLREDPFTVRRTVRWADCDPAGVVFTGRFSDYVLSAVALFKEFIAESTGGEGKSLGERFNVGLPCRGMTFDFHGTLWPNDSIDIRCSIGEVRTRSFDILLDAKSPDSRPIFTAKFSPICVRNDARVGTDIPDAMRKALAQFSQKPLKQTELT
ncbi:acyl-CoA thioesterase [Caballeronia novacaledonica]|uniref:acyl-CoA thioesterase n=1 Tax=Caballeronia novacaledonica TaxID=1544861 RepID=UPI001EE2C128|nr:acyl-CoA thioesterase [Caballeronia novacaledonica]GJH14221.1 acyl-CoA thioesterase [Caballeronia novacaledonica]